MTLAEMLRQRCLCHCRYVMLEETLEYNFQCNCWPWCMHVCAFNCECSVIPCNTALYIYYNGCIIYKCKNVIMQINLLEIIFCSDFAIGI